MYKKHIENIIEDFSISQNIQNHHKNPWGNFLSKINFLFKNGNITIKAEVREINNTYYFISNNFPNSKWKVGYGQTWHYIYFGLFFLGLINNREYGDDKIKKGIEVPCFRKYESLLEYLKSSEAKINILENFKSDPIYFQGMIRGSLLEFITRNNIKTTFFTNSEINEWINKRYRSKFAFLFEAIYTALYGDAFSEKSLSSFIDKTSKKENLFRNENYKKQEISIINKDFYLKNKVKKY